MRNAGGELIIRHQGRETVVDMTTDEPSELVYAAFYADCEHEILPVTDGHRVCLVYNLMLQDESDTPLKAPDYGAEIDLIAAELGARCRDPGASGKLIWLLEHDYSAAGLSFGTLKNVDAAIGRVLMAAAERAGCSLHAAIVRVEETGSGWYGGYQEIVEDITDREFELYDIVDVDCWLDGWARPDGAPADFGALPLLPGELMPAGRLDSERPDSQRLLEASGNEGATIERLYRRAALVVWPKSDSARLLAQAGAGSLAAFLAGEWQRASAGAPTCVPIRDLASQVVELWPSCDTHRRRSQGDSWEGHSARTLELLCSIGNREASARFLSDVVLPNYDGEMNGALVTAAAEMGVGEMREFLCALAGARTSLRTEGIVDLASQLCERLDNGRDGPWHDALRQMVTTVCAQMPSVRRPSKSDDHVDWRCRPTRAEPAPLPTATLRQFFLLLWRFDMEREADAAASLFIERGDLVAPDRTIPALMEALSAEHGEPFGTSPALHALWLHGARFLLSRSRLPPAPPTDWVISAEGLSCDCEHCAELRRFCADPDSETLRMPVRKELRGHLRRQIEQGGIDIRLRDREARQAVHSCVRQDPRGIREAASAVRGRHRRDAPTAGNGRGRSGFGRHRASASRRDCAIPLNGKRNAPKDTCELLQGPTTTEGSFASGPLTPCTRTRPRRQRLLAQPVPHFMSAVVLQQTQYPAGTIERRIVEKTQLLWRHSPPASGTRRHAPAGSLRDRALNRSGRRARELRPAA